MICTRGHQQLCLHYLFIVLDTVEVVGGGAVLILVNAKVIFKVELQGLIKNHGFVDLFKSCVPGPHKSQVQLLVVQINKLGCCVDSKVNWWFNHGSPLLDQHCHLVVTFDLSPDCIKVFVQVRLQKSTFESLEGTATIIVSRGLSIASSISLSVASSVSLLGGGCFVVDGLVHLALENRNHRCLIEL